MVSKQDVKKLVGQQIYAVKKDGSVFEGKLLQTRGNKLILAPSHKDKKVKTSAFIPLVLFDLLAIGTGPFGFERFPFRREFEFEFPFFRRDFF